MAAGLVCPSCGSSYRAGFTQCHTCQVDLVDAAQIEDVKRKLDSPRAALEGVEKEPIVHAGIAACREIEAALLEAGIPCYVDAETEESDVLAAPGAMKIGVVIASADKPRALEFLQKRFEALIEREGVGSLNTEAIDISAAEVECPACGHKGALVDGACGDCGLFLGEPEQHGD